MHAPTICGDLMGRSNARFCSGVFLLHCGAITGAGAISESGACRVASRAPLRRRSGFSDGRVWLARVLWAEDEQSPTARRTSNGRHATRRGNSSRSEVLWLPGR